MERMPLVSVPVEIEARLAQLGGRTVNLYRALANHPDLLTAYIEFAWALRQRCKTPRRLRELMIVRGAQMCQSAYELDQHTTMAKAAGVSDLELKDLANWRASGLFAPAERAALGYMEEVVNQSVSEVTVSQLHEHFTNSERIELTMTAAFYTMVPRMLDALAVPRDNPDSRLEAHGDGLG
jgi:4-carboxymuconolactone decarboxylase